MTEKKDPAGIERAVAEYFEAYDRYQLLFATFRLQGWDGNIRTSPPKLVEAFNKMDAKKLALRLAAGIGHQPNYLADAQARIGPPARA